FSLLLSPRPPRPTLFPYTTLFRSGPAQIHRGVSAGSAVGCACAHRLARAGRSPGRRTGARPPAVVLHRLSRTPDLHRHEARGARSEEHTSELQSRVDLVCRLLLEK